MDEDQKLQDTPQDTQVSDTSDQSDTRIISDTSDSLTTSDFSDQSGSGDAQILLNMEGMIKSHIQTIDQLNGEMKKYKDMLNDIFANDPTYQKHNEAAQEAAKIKAATRAQILKQPHAAELQQKVKSMQSEIKETQGALSDYLQEYARLSGTNEIEDEEGEVREIVYTAKLVRKSQFRP